MPHSLQPNWDETEKLLDELEKEQVVFYDSYPLDEIRKNPELQNWLKQWRKACTLVGELRFDLIQQGFRTQS